MRNTIWLAVFFLATCVATAEQTPEPVALPPIETEAGQSFTVTLDANPTTGYMWQFAARLDEAVVKLVGSEFKQSDGKLVGAGGKQIWTFKAVGKGNTKISLKYVRPWEKGVPPAKTATVEVTVR